MTPIISLDTTSISIAPGGHGSFTVKNTGGGTLSGNIISRCNALHFSPMRWEGNNQVISYSMAQDVSAATESVAYICTTGGEKVLPITINSTAMSIPTEEGAVLASIQEFYNFAQAYPLSARRIFTSSEFYMLLLSTGYEYMEVYEALHKDVNRERAMDNFFIVSSLKPYTPPEPPQEDMPRVPIIINLTHTGFRYEDRGGIKVENNTGHDLTIEIESLDRFLRFKTSKYIVATTGEIPFEIRPTAFASAQRLFRKLPYVSTYIDIKAHCPGRIFRKRLYLNIGEW